MGGEFHVALADAELWPDAVVCYTQWTSTRRPYEERIYVPERTARRIAVFSEGTDFTVGHSECSECNGSINPCAKWCEHCGCKFEGDE
jgi:hypothetical protein